MKLELAGRNVLVTGSSMGIGRGLSECFARQGANLFLADHPRQRERLEAWADELSRSCGVRTWTFCADLTGKGGPEALHREALARAGAVHALVNNAGICWFGKFHEMPLEKLEAMLLLNAMAYAKLTRLFLPPMIERDEGGILNVSSVSAFQPVPTLGLYAATKAFTQSLTEAVRGELPRGSRVVVSTLNPPFTKTGLIEDAGVPPDYIPLVMSFMDIDEVTRSGVEAFGKGRVRFVPGLHNRVFYLGLARFLPHTILDLITRLLTRRLSDCLPAPVASFIEDLRR
ncbi:MAG TPA: SDR family NAD(P)-dependent oxidoreductase [Deltaproteobacteria bacterium]|jgi:hypothetical protein|nr:SDR family NAD(P)-dependent oxidoreductase [Deltaproteobacteria bacterium]HOI06270.1 SDR family NAD(P)-dependent oxidoreductase [Deltaproteobacteria bacterium]